MGSGKVLQIYKLHVLKIPNTNSKGLCSLSSSYKSCLVLWWSVVDKAIFFFCITTVQINNLCLLFFFFFSTTFPPAFSHEIILLASVTARWQQGREQGCVLPKIMLPGSTSSVCLLFVRNVWEMMVPWQADRNLPVGARHQGWLKTVGAMATVCNILPSLAQSPLSTWAGS